MAHGAGVGGADALARLLLSAGWRRGQPGGYRGDLALDTSELFTFLGAGQPREWERVVAGYDDADAAQRKFARRVAGELDRRGVLDVLRRGVVDQGIAIRLADPRGGGGTLGPDDRPSLIRDLHHTPSRPSRAVGLALFVNGVPVATVEVADASGPGPRHAAERHRTGREPAGPLLGTRALLHLAVGPGGVLAGTRPAGAQTPFSTVTVTPGPPGVPFWRPGSVLGLLERLT